MLSGVQQLYASEGIRGFYRGVAPGVSRARVGIILSGPLTLPRLRLGLEICLGIGWVRVKVRANADKGI
eukprot:324652-Amorphochlora_amoeboformis.AAC.1